MPGAPADTTACATSFPRRVRASGACASASDTPGGKNEVVDFVLTHAGKDEQRTIDETIVAGADAIEVMLRDGAQIAMNKLHSRVKPPA